AGLSFNTGTGAITGTPTASTNGQQSFTVTASNSCGSAQVNVNITVLTRLSALSYTSPNVSYCTGSAITPNTVAAITGQGAVTYSISPALPTGLSINSATGAISGTPTVAAAAANYTVTASNGCSTTTATVNITVNGVPTITSVTATLSTICNGSSSNL